MTTRRCTESAPQSREEKICIANRNKQKIIDVINGFYHLDVLHRVHIE